MSSAPEDGVYELMESKESKKTHSARDPLLFTVLIALLAIFAAGAFHLSVVSDSHHRFSHRKSSGPDFEWHNRLPILRRARHDVPEMIFPMYITRVNADSPDTVYNSSTSVVLSSTDSMIYHWRTISKWPMCYITGWVSPSKDLIAGHKSYISEGTLRLSKYGILPLLKTGKN
ncbi:hypothetical protein B0H13DRAFT_2370701 [Mycena leptocephala]|nr:hypothetical protein B0H13DRAFT_2370701 [Mycena leptocephala]